MKKLRRLIIVVFALLVMAAIAAPQVQAAAYWKLKVMRFAGTAGETLAIGNVVYKKASDGLYWKSDADDGTKWPPVGIIGKAASASGSTEIVTMGILGGLTLTDGYGPIFLSTTAGEMINNKNTTTQNWVLGWASSTTTAIISISGTVSK